VSKQPSFSFFFSLSLSYSLSVSLSLCLFRSPAPSIHRFICNKLKGKSTSSFSLTFPKKMSEHKKVKKKISMGVSTIFNVSLKHLQRESQPSPMWVSPDFGLSLYQVSINFRLTLKKLSKQSRSVSFRTLVDKIEKHHHVMTHFDLCKNFHMCLTSHCIPFWSKLSNCQTAKTENFVCYQGPDVSKHVTFSLCRVSWQKRKVSASWGPFWSMSRFMIQLKGSFILSIT
jgi:hypothetical protein